METNATKSKKDQMKKLAYLILAIAVYVGLASMEPPQGLSPEGWKGIALIIAATITWVSEFIPIGVSSCLLLFLPSLLNIDTTGNIMTNFATPTLFFILSALLIAQAFEKVGFGQRVSLRVTTILGNKSKYVLLSLMGCTALLSAFLVNIPSAIIVGAIAYEVLRKNNCLPGESEFGKSIMLGIPIAASVGGVSTPAGSGVNILAINLLKNVTGIEIGFLQWSIVGVPLAILLTIVSWLVLCMFYKPELEEIKGFEDIEEERKKLGKVGRDEKIFIIVFGTVIILWMTSSLTGLETAFVSMLAATIFFLPGIDILNWKEASKKIGWETLLLVGSCNALAMILSDHGSAQWISDTLLGGLIGSSLLVVLLAVSTFGIFIHLLVPISGAIIAITVPIVAVLAQTMGMDPVYLVLTLAYTASCVFLIPLDPTCLTTHGYGYWDIKDMSKPGFVIGVLWILILVPLMYAAISLNLI